MPIGNRVSTILFLLLPVLAFCQVEDAKHSHQSVYTEFGTSTLLVKGAQLSSTHNFKWSVGFLQLFDLGERWQFRCGVGITGYRTSIDDFGLQWSSQVDTSGQWTGSGHSGFLRTDIAILDLTMPANVRLKLFGQENHAFVALGFEGRVKVHSNQTNSVSEPGGGDYEVAGEVLQLRSGNLMVSFAFGYELGVGVRHKLNFSAFTNYGCWTQGPGVSLSGNQLIVPSESGHLTDLGVGIGFIF